jgi:hypothetical protein
MQQCVFCGTTGKMIAEHVFPNWSQPFLDSAAGPGTHTRTIVRADVKATNEHRSCRSQTRTTRSVADGIDQRTI